jgi:hypothetical protein
MGILSIAQIEHAAGIEVHGAARVCLFENKLASNNCEYKHLVLADGGGEINAYGWADTMRRDIHELSEEIVLITGRTKLLPRNNELAIDLYDVAPLRCITENPLLLYPLADGADSSDVSELISIMESISSKSLRLFLYEVFADQKLTNVYLTGKGSDCNHHSELSGLLRHSLEVANFVRQSKQIKYYEQEVAIAAALLHDIAKTRAYYNDRRYKNSFMVSHDLRTYRILTSSLDRLQERWPDGAELLQICIEALVDRKKFYSSRKHIPVAADLVWMGDQVSTGSFKERRAEQFMKSWQSQIKIDGELFWRCRPDNYDVGIHLAA